MTTSDPDGLVYAAQAATIAGVSKTAISKAVDRGHITKDASGRIARADLHRWMKGRRPARGNQAETARQPDQVTAEVAVQVTTSEAHRRTAELMARPEAVFATRAEADLYRASYEARLKAVEYDLQVGTVVLVADVAGIVGGQLAAVRTKMLALPSNLAPRVARLTRPAEVEAVIARAVHEALEALTADGGDAGRR